MAKQSPKLVWNEPFAKEYSDEILDGLRELYQDRLSRDVLAAFPGLSERAVSDRARYCALGNLSPDTILSVYPGISCLDFLVLRQIAGLYEKNDSVDLQVDRRETAKRKWLEAERTCGISNDIFRAHHQGRFFFRPDVDGILHTAQRKIAMVLGKCPKIADLKLRFGPGATTTLTKRKASPRYKLGDTKSCSEGLFNIITDVVEEMPTWFGISDLEDYTVDINLSVSKVSFVPKNAKTDRSIAVEPVLNLMVQLGIGDYMTDRIKRKTGIDLSKQENNQLLARLGSMTGALATLDLSSASDLISIGVVRSLLPTDWFDLLYACRSARCELDGETIMLNKFSSMGNGFTFPLQTLIFWALASATASALGRYVSDESLRVYGDDIIVPCKDESDFRLYRDVLTACGFSLNKEKSFYSGPFRESCGTDYFLGINVRPQFVRSVLSYKELFRLSNAAHREHDDEVREYLLSFVPEPIRLYGPDGYGDGHLIVSEPLRYAEAHRRNDGWGGYTFETYTLKGRKSFRPSPGDYVYPSYSIYVTGGTVSNNPHPWKGDSFGVDLPGVGGYKRIKIYTLGF